MNKKLTTLCSALLVIHSTSVQSSSNGSERLEKFAAEGHASHGWNPGVNTGGDLDILFNKLYPAISPVRQWRRHSSNVNLEFIGSYTINPNGEINGNQKVTQVDDLEIVADTTLQESFTNLTSTELMWTPSSTYSQTEKITSTTSDTWSHKNSYGVSIKYEAEVDLIFAKDKITSEYRTDVAFEQGGIKSKTEEFSKTITVGSGGRFPVSPGETLTIQDIYGKTSTTLLIPSRSLIFGDVNYFEGEYDSGHLRGFGIYLSWFIEDWNQKKDQLYAEGKIGHADLLAGDRLYKALKAPDGNYVAEPSQTELNFAASNYKVWGSFQDHFEHEHQYWRQIGAELPYAQHLGVIDGVLTTKIEANTGVHSRAYSSEPEMSKRGLNPIYTQQGYDSNYNVPIIKWNRFDRLVKNGLVRGMSFSPNLSGSITLTEHDDLFNGGDGKDVVYPLGGSDIIHLGGGDDVIISPASGDTSDNSLDMDIFYGEEGDDNITQNNITSHTTFYGGDGNDTLESKALKSAMVGGRGLDTFILHDSVEHASIRDEDPEQGLLINLFCKNDEAINIIRASDGENIIIYFKSADKIRKVSLLNIIGSGGVNISFRNKKSNTPDWLVSETELQALADEENGSFKCNSQH
ncbi:hypothetical protein ACU6DI_000976 [Vibrio navarrensis]